MRSISQIYSEAVLARNNYLQLTELDSGRSNSKLSIINLLTYVTAVCIHTYEAVLDAFQVKIAQILSGRINGTADWYAAMSKKFQYDPVTGNGDELRFNDDTMKIEYATINPGHRIIDKVAWQTDEGGQALLLKVSKANTKTGAQEGVPYLPLTENELTAFKTFVQKIKFIGATIYCQSIPGDILTIVSDENAPIFYDDRYISANQALLNIRSALVDFVNSSRYNDFIYFQDIIDALQKTEHISYLSNHVKIFISSYNQQKNEYDEPTELISRIRLKSGYAQLLDIDSLPTINNTNICLTYIIHRG